MKFQSGNSVIVILHSPREKVLGMLDEITTAGVSVRAIDLNYFDDWVNSIVADEPHLPMDDYFFPMWRVERVTRDETNGDIPSMADQFEKRTGRKMAEF
jgi:hypothetical protein